MTEEQKNCKHKFEHKATTVNVINKNNMTNGYASARIISVSEYFCPMCLHEQETVKKFSWSIHECPDIPVWAEIEADKLREEYHLYNKR